MQNNTKFFSYKTLKYKNEKIFQKNTKVLFS